MDNAPKIAVLVVLALLVGGIFFTSSKSYSQNVSEKATSQTDSLFNSANSSLPSSGH